MRARDKRSKQKIFNFVIEKIHDGKFVRNSWFDEDGNCDALVHLISPRARKQYLAGHPKQFLKEEKELRKIHGNEFIDMLYSISTVRSSRRIQRIRAIAKRFNLSSVTSIAPIAGK